MGSRLAKPPPLDRPIAPGRGPTTGLARPFPVLTPQSYVPGGAGLYPGYGTPGGTRNFPMLNQNSFLPPGGEPPIMNLSGGPNFLPPPMPYPPMMGQGMPPAMSLPPPMPYPNVNMMSIEPQPAFYEPELRSYMPRRRRVRVCRRRPRRSRRCRPVIQIIDSSSCSSLSSCTTISSCSHRRRRRSCSHSRRSAAAPQQQQPIILLPMQCQQPAPTPGPIQNPIQQQPQQIILPPIQVQQPGQIQPQQLALPPIPFQQQQLALPSIPLNSSNIFPSTNSSPMIIASGQPMIQPSMSLPQIANFGQPQQMHSGVIQYVQGGQQSSSPLQYISAEPRSTVAPQRGFVNSSNKKQTTLIKTVPRTASIRDVPQNDLKFGRRPFDWYGTEKKQKNIINENIRVGQRGSTAVS